MTAKVTLEGAEELRAALKALPAKLGGTVLRDAAVEAIEPVLDRARQLVPVREGKLRRALKTQIRHESQTYVDVRVGANLIRSAGEIAPHAHLVEYGTGPRHDKAGRYLGQVTARPFLRPAWDAERANIEPRFQRALTKALAAYVWRT